MFPQGNPDTGKVHGVMIGVVTNNKDPEKQGRVKLKLPLRESETETDWTRVATLMAGKDMGSYFIPEVGDEVLVSFHMGEVREPFVIGMLWSKQDTPPAGAYTEKNDIRKIKSRGGHEIIFDDKNGDGKITIKTKDGHQIEILDKTDVISIEDKSGNNKLEIKGGSANEVTLKSSQSSVKMTTKGDITIESPKSLKLKSTEITIEATAQLNIKANAKIDVNSSGLLNIKGSMVKIN